VRLSRFRLCAGCAATFSRDTVRHCVQRVSASGSMSVADFCETIREDLDVKLSSDYGERLPAVREEFASVFIEGDKERTAFKRLAAAVKANFKVIASFLVRKRTPRTR
jgi:hypothetical protein